MKILYGKPQASARREESGRGRRLATILVSLLTGVVAFLPGVVFSTTPAFATSALWSSVPTPFACSAKDNSCVAHTGFDPLVSTWGQYANRLGNCTNYAAYRLARNGATALAGSGDARTWRDRVQKQFGPAAVTSTPEVGSIAWWGSAYGGGSGHVAYVERVSGDTIYLSESSWNTGSGRRTMVKGAKGWPEGFLHIKDAPKVAPAAPKSVRVTATTGATLTIGWSDASDNEDAFVVQSRIGSGSWTSTTASADSTSATVSGLKPGTTYTVRVGAQNLVGTTWSSTLSARTVAVGDASTSVAAWTRAYSAGLGTPLNAVHKWGPGCVQDFRGGALGDAALMQKGCAGTVYAVTGSHWKRVAEIGSATIGYPNNNSHRYGKSWTQDFSGGAWGAVLLMIPDVSNRNAFVVRSGMRTRYLADGGADGRWRAPTSDEYAVPVGAKQNFVGGVMTWRAYSDSLAENRALATGGKLFSADERYQLVVQGDGNLVLYGPSGAVWATNTVGVTGAHLAMQGDSNLVLYDGAGRARWNSGTTTFKGAHLVVQNDGNLVVYDRNGVAIWTRGSGRLRVDPQGTISFRSTLTNRFWTAELGKSGNWYGAVRAERTGVGSWETFQLVGDCRSAGGCAIKSLANGRYLSAELNFTGDGDKMVRARSTSIGAWEKFQLVGDCGSSGGCGVKSLANGKYLSADYYFGTGDYRYGLVRARAASVSGWESFRIYET